MRREKQTGARGASRRMGRRMSEHGSTSDSRRTRAGVRLGRAAAALTGAALAALPLIASAAEGTTAATGRTLDAPPSFGPAVFATAVAALTVLAVAALGRLYQLQRGIRWRFQDPDSPQHDEGHH
jgi:hypothetical protein